MLQIEKDFTNVNGKKFYIDFMNSMDVLDFVENSLQNQFIEVLGEGETVTYLLLLDLKEFMENDIEWTKNRIKAAEQNNTKLKLTKIRKNSLLMSYEELDKIKNCIEKLEDVFAWELKNNTFGYVKENEEELQEYKHKHKDNLCYCCNELHVKKDIKTFKVNGRGYGSIFDTMNFDVQLCPECAAKIKQEWFNNSYDELWGYDDVTEHELWDFLNTFRIENQEYMFNINTIFEDAIDRKDWIEQVKEEDQKETKILNSSVNEDIVSEKEQNNIINLLSYIHNFTC